MPNLEVTLDEADERISKALEKSAKASEKQADAMEKAMRKATEAWNKSMDKDALSGLKRSLALGANTGMEFQGGGGGGIFDMLKGAFTKMLPNAIQTGLVSGLATGGVMALVSILTEVVDNSKILKTVLGTIGKALGLLLDVVLLPFLPAIIMGIIWLYRGIMTFSKIWSGFWNSPVGKGIMAFVAFFATGGVWRVSVEFLVAFWGAIFKWLYELSTSGASAVVNIAFGVAGAFFGFLDWLFKLVNIDMGKISLEVLLTNAGGWFVDLLDWIRQGVANIVVTLSNPGEAVGKAVEGATSDPLRTLMNVLPGGGIAGSVWDTFVKGHAEGGYVSESGIAVVHKGENITPAGSGANITFNFPNYVGSKSDLQKMISDVLRQQQYRYNV